MVLPITGPVSKTTISGPAYRQSLRREQSRYRQAAPYTLPLNYSMWELRTTQWIQYRGGESDWSTSWNQCLSPDVSYSEPIKAHSWPAQQSYFNGIRTQALNQARSRFSSKLQADKAQLLNLYLERQQAMNSLSSRLLRLATWFKYVRRDPLRAIHSVILDKDLSKAQVRQLRKAREGDTWRAFKRGAKPYADLHLEVMFGLIPTYSDINSAINILGSGVPPAKISTTGRASSKYRQEQYSYGWPSGEPPRTKPAGLGGSSKLYYTHDMTCVARVGAEISVSNPNMFLANQLGIINIPGAIFEAAPWSFFLDYFVNCSEFLSQFTETWGLNVQNPYYSTLCRDIATVECYAFNGPQAASGGPLYIYGPSRQEGVVMNRTSGALPGVKLAIRAPWTLSARRASTTVALLLQRLPRK